MEFGPVFLMTVRTVPSGGEKLRVRLKAVLPVVKSLVVRMGLPLEEKAAWKTGEGLRR